MFSKRVSRIWYAENERLLKERHEYERLMGTDAFSNFCKGPRSLV